MSRDHLTIAFEREIELESEITRDSNQQLFASTMQLHVHGSNVVDGGGGGVVGIKVPSDNEL